MYSKTSGLKVPPPRESGDVFRDEENGSGRNGSGSGSGNPPALLEAVNKNGLVLFLIVSPPAFTSNSRFNSLINLGDRPT